MVRLFRIFIPQSVLFLLISEVLLIAAGFVAAAFLTPGIDPVFYLLYGNGPVNIALVLITIVLGLYLQDLYTDIYVRSHIILLQQLCVVMGTACIVQSFVNYLNANLRMPLHTLAPGASISMVGIYGWRVFFSSYLVRIMGGDRLLLVGNSPLLAEVAEHVRQHPEIGASVIGVVNDQPDYPGAPPGGKYLGPLDSLPEIVTATCPTRIVVGMRERRNRLPVAALLELRYAGNVIEEAATAFERVCGRISTKEIRPSQLIYSGEFSGRRQTILYQTFGNIVVAAIGVMVGLPLMVVTALAVKLSSRGPVLYRQRRVGMDGVEFTLFKFRSMRVDAELGTGAVWAMKNDPRVTSVGRIIRKIRFDELPQLFNVLRGEMSIVGPRPERPEFVKTLAERIPYYRQRHAVRPGITGWAQISYKYGDTLEDSVTKLEYDLYYIKNMSWSLDLYIIFHTMKAMLLSRGAQ
jgi:sugar transferase (PEP-CTERM system associated)